MKYEEFSEMEWKVLVSYWAAGKPLTAAELSVQFNLNNSTVLTVVRKLLQADILEVVGHVKKRRFLARKYSPRVTESDFFTDNLDQLDISRLTEIFLNRMKDEKTCLYLLNMINLSKSS
ncbi:BlaI/MecI/CopY family transcriptional regulator [Enterococcus innesii]|uniref:BlaI/MecI/CopY family transcriptional regulator n=1 Tax=Enterococcus innesii TaxID=2839759 RepID=UPI0039849611